MKALAHTHDAGPYHAPPSDRPQRAVGAATTKNPSHLASPRLTLAETHRSPQRLQDKEMGLHPLREPVQMPLPLSSLVLVDSMV